MLDAQTDAVRDTLIVARYAIVSGEGGAVERSKLFSACGGLIAYRGVTTIKSSEIKVQDPGCIGVFAGSGGSNVTVKADGLDILGSGKSNLVGIEADNSGAPATNAGVELDNALIRGTSTALRATSGAAATGTVHIAASYSDYNGSGNLVGGPKASIGESHISNIGDAGFGPDGYEDLLRTSALVDAGDPATAQGLDLGGKTLVTDGDGDGTARRDIGAIELSAAPMPAASGSQPPADASPAGAAGQSGTGSIPTPLATDTQPPRVTGLTLTRKAFAVGSARTAAVALFRGTRFRYVLSEAATVVIRFKRGARNAGTLTRTATAGVNTLRFSGRIGRRALKAGRYSAVVTATDAAGNKSQPQRLRFRVVRS
jgi:hypothetical protein